MAKRSDLNVRLVLLVLLSSLWPVGQAAVSCDSGSNPQAPECRRSSVGANGNAAAILQGVGSAISNALAQQQQDEQNLAGERAREAEKAQRAQSDASALVDQMANRPESNPWAALQNSRKASSGKVPAALPQLPALSSDCNAAQQQGMAFARKLSLSVAALGPSVCQSARAHKLLGELQIQVAQHCRSIPTWTELQRAGQNMVDDANRTIAGSCQ
ncbi:MAG: hypothetical protein ACTHJ1_05140 [Bordetella sp.]|uniref:hypothetical protein n=1 Tax=Bordetella sp. TaxID=28081 RepID=UPI003F7C4739